MTDVLVDIVRSFHSDMMATTRVDGELLEAIGVSNRLRQDCTMAQWHPPSLTCTHVVAERWLERVKGSVGVGTRLLYKLDEQLFRRSTRRTSEVLVPKGEFADDVVLLASSRQAAEAAIRSYVDVTNALLG